jgi:hypothetical protein
MWWMEFMRTGNRDYYLTAQSNSAHAMDVDNIHWPAPKRYLGDTNNSIDFFDNKEKGSIGASPYLGMGRRHANQHFTSLLSAHVWVQGWIASYLSVWNLSEIYDVNKKEKYFTELNDRVNIMLDLQKSTDQGGSLVLDRYGYSQIYVSHGLYKYYQMTGDDKIKKALITHAKWQRDNPSINHQMESLLATLHGLSIGYEFTKDQSFLKEGIRRAQNLVTDKLPLNFNAYKNQKDLSDALEKVSHLPDDKESFRREAIWKITNGLRIFGWTHMFGIPYLQNKMDKANLNIKSK